VISLDEKRALTGAAIEGRFRVQIRLISLTKAVPKSKCG